MAEPSPEIGAELRQFFTDLLDRTNLREYHANAERYVKEQQGNGVIGEEAAQLILSGSLQDIEANIMLVTGSGSAVPVCIVMPPM